MAGINPKQRKFIEEYLVDLNATRAATRAGYSAKTAEQQGWSLLRNPKVAEAIQAGRAELSARVGVTQEMVLNELRRIGFGDLRKLFDEQGDLKAARDLDDDTAARIARIEVVVRPKPGGRRGEVERVAKIRAWDKVAALEKLGKHLGMFVDRTEMSGSVTVNLNSDDSAL